MRGNLDSYGTFEKYLDDKTRGEFLGKINHVVEWIYSDEGAAAKKGDYEKVFNEFKAIGDPVKQRHFYYSELDVYFGQFNQIGQNINDKLGSIEHLTEE